MLEADDFKEKLNMLNGKPLTDALKQNIRNIITTNHYEDKSYLNQINIVKRKMTD